MLAHEYNFTHTMQKENSYKIDKFKFKNEELARLTKRTTFRIEEFENSLRGIVLKKNSSILEIGSGTGHRAAVLAKRFPKSKVIGIDISETMVELSSKIFGAIPNLAFMKKNVNSLKEFGKEKFDLIYLRLVTQHLKHPDQIIALCYQSLKKGGRLIVEDVDRHLMTFYPSLDLWDDLYALAMKAHQKNGGDPYVGRKLYSYLNKSRFLKIDNLSYLHTGDESFFNLWVDDFAPSFFNNLSTEKRRVAKKCLSKMKQNNKDSPTSFTQVWFLYRAIK